MNNEENTIKCHRCSALVTTNFCPHCGCPRTPKRIDSRFLLGELGSIFNFQKGIFYTLKELLIRPGKSIRVYMHEDRAKLVKPISFIILCSLIYTVAQRNLGFQDGYMNFTDVEGMAPAVSAIMSWLSANYGFTNILVAVCIAFWVKLLFWKHPYYNLFEILILLYFVIGVEMLLITMFGTIEGVTSWPVVDDGGVVLATLYVGWAIGQFFEDWRVWNILKGVFCYFLSLFTFIFVAIAIGVFVQMAL